MKLTDERILNFITKKHADDENFDLEKYLNPSESDFRDAKIFTDIDKIVDKINKAIADKKRILVYGDYDCDGISATTILYLYLSSVGADVNVFIPNRFENGYGISVDAIDEIVNEYAPELIITVDLGITAVEEVEILKEEGIDIIITDHHLPLAEVPDCLLLDPKYNNKEYGFDGLCGAGVAMKLVEALAGRGEANRYLDIAAIATIGDIVPLIDENRAIARLGINKINGGQCLKSISFIKKKLEIEELTSSDISFKIVPRLNACGRMDNALKVFEFLIEEDESELENKFNEIESDNGLRLAFIDKGNKEIDKCLEKYDNSKMAILLKGDFHEGVVGILASRVCHEYNKPTIIFTKTEDGTLKGSGRSIESVDLHKIILSINGMLENFGGHKMAVGVEILPENFDEFEKVLNEKIAEEVNLSAFVKNGGEFDIEVNDEDFSMAFLNQVKMLEPFGCENEKPVFAIKQSDMITQPISEKSYKHFKAFTKKNNPIVCFNYYKGIDTLKSESSKYILVDMQENVYKGKSSVNAYTKGVFVTDAKLPEFNEDALLTALYNKYCSIFDFNSRENYHTQADILSVIKDRFAESDFGTLVVASNARDLDKLKSIDVSKYFSASPYKNGQNAVLVEPKGVYDINDVKGYKNIIFMSKFFDEEHLYFSQKFNVYEAVENTEKPEAFSKEREVFAKVYKHICNFSALKANDAIELAKKLGVKEQSVSVAQILYSMIVFMELNFIEFDDVLGNIVICKAKKMELSSSKFLNSVE